jgi:putative colanic acid biosynthesis acetyltransferase WcaF
VERNKTDLSKFNNDWYKPGGNSFARILWYFVNAAIFQSYFFPFYSFKTSLLRMFGASIGIGVFIKPAVNIKYPWLLTIGNNVWIGENAWIDNLATVQIGNNVCISQGAMLLTGNHNYKRATFDLMVGSIVVEDGAWIGAKSIVCPGVICRSHAILSVGSVASANLEPYGIYQGIPAVKVRTRIIGA